MAERMTDEIYYFNENRPFTEDELKELKNYEVLHLGDKFNQPLDNLPDNIKHITFITDKDSDNWSSFNQPLENLPSKLESLNLMSCEFKQSLDYLPSSLKYFKLYLANPFYQENLLYNLPANLEHLCLYSNNNKYYSIPIDENHLFNLNHLPANLKILEIMPNTYQPIENLPKGLETLIIYNNAFLCHPEHVLCNLPENLNLLVLNFSVNVNYKIVIKKLFNNKLTCKNVMLYSSESRTLEHMQNISHIRKSFPRVKILCNDTYHMF